MKKIPRKIIDAKMIPLYENSSALTGELKQEPIRAKNKTEQNRVLILDRSSSAAWTGYRDKNKIKRGREKEMRRENKEGEELRIRVGVNERHKA